MHSHRTEPETGSIRKDHDGRLRVALCYPNTYAVGMSNLALQGLYGRLNARDDVCCERAFYDPDTPDTRTVESDTRLADMDVVAFTVSFEMDYPTIARMLTRGGMNPFAADRRGGPIVLAGGAAVSTNPEPVAPFLDAVFIGEAESSLDALVDGLKGAARGDRTALDALPGLYRPALGRHPVSRIIEPVLSPPLTTTVFTPHTEFGEMALIEVARGCPYGCAFCVASHGYRPARWTPGADVLAAVDALLPHRTRIGLIGASVTDHPDIIEICAGILSRGARPSPASMRADALTDDLLALLAEGGVRTVTLAPEAGTEALRRSLGKQLSDAAIMAAAMRARAAGITQVKLYFIVGLPGETEDDVRAIPALALRVAHEAGVKVSVGSSVLVPKAGTPFARIAAPDPRIATRTLAAIRRALGGQLAFSHESARWAVWQTVLARGGRELAPLLARIAEGPDTPGAWNAAAADLGLAPEAYLAAIPPDAPLPWGHVGCTRAMAGG
jgi:radical SAM superfamily enzyme YgiQ (UPF0313 family)